MKKIFGEQIMKNHNVINNLKFVFGHIKKNEKKLIVMSILSAVIYALSAYIMPILSKIIIDSVIAEKSVKFLIVSIIIMLVVQVLISDVSEYIFFQSWWRIIRARYSFEPLRLNQILSIRYDKLEKQETLNLAQKAAAATENNSNGIESFLRNLQAFLTSGFQLVIAMFLIVSLNPIVVLLMLIFAYIGYRITGNARKKDKELMWDILPQYERGRDYYKNISKDFSYGKDIRLFNMQKFILNKEKREAKMVHQIMKKSNNRWIKYSTINYCYFLMNEIVMYAWLVYAVLQGQIGIGDFSLYLMTMKTFFESISTFLDSISRIKKDSYEVSDFRRFIELPEENNGKCLILEKDIPVKIEFKNVSFRYPDQEENIINDISFQINESDRIAIVGYNGAGKSTIIKLLCRLYDPTDGKILMNGEDIKEATVFGYFRRYFKILICLPFQLRKMLL
ncbi:ABC transporter ATP-binding protein [Lachnospiraceae bacterium 48-33]